ncbi:MAG TPA: hypothetical protein VK525_04800 [Candidatus Saccharimonadales bacterium]|jgi:hypothetical protein|nr:hypothetical protein [Candidatus Saccharimonadales bacterium]
MKGKVLRISMAAIALILVAIILLVVTRLAVSFAVLQVALGDNRMILAGNVVQVFWEIPVPVRRHTLRSVLERVPVLRQLIGCPGRVSCGLVHAVVERFGEQAAGSLSAVRPAKPSDGDFPARESSQRIVR